MPNKSAVPEPEAQDVKPNLCGHANKHFTGDYEMTCNLPPFHQGNHQAEYQRLVPGSDKLPSGAQYVKAVTAWGDDAGISVDEVEAFMREEAAANSPKPKSLVQRMGRERLERMRTADTSHLKKEVQEYGNLTPFTGQ